MACVTRTSRLLTLQAVLRVLVDIDHPARSLALFFLEPRRSARVPRALCNSYPSVEHIPFLYACVCVVFHQLTTSFTERDVLSLTPACLAKALWAADVFPVPSGMIFPWLSLVHAHSARACRTYCGTVGGEFFLQRTGRDVGR